jgi:hypothetical protein
MRPPQGLIDDQICQLFEVVKDDERATRYGNGD